MNYQESLEWLAKLASEQQFFQRKKQPSLDEVNRALNLLGRPDKTFKYRVVVGGTAGKGTTCRYVEQALLAQGKTVALLSSPHVQVVNERIRLNGKLVCRQRFSAGVSAIKTLLETEALSLTYYEVIVLAGVYLAAEAQVEILICEVGLGGEFDAVNAVQGARISALTFIGDDHREILGPNLENIAQTKAGIFTKDCVLCLSCEQNYCSILNKKSNSEIFYIKGVKQKLNKKLARKIAEKILNPDAFFMDNPKLPCRWETLKTKSEDLGGKSDQKIILEGAHSLPRFKYLMASKLKKQPGPYVLILGMQKNHDMATFECILPYASHVIWTEVGSGAYSAENLKNEYGVGEVIKNPLEALEKAQSLVDPILVTGSFYLCGAIREVFYSADDMLEQQTEWPE